MFHRFFAMGVWITVCGLLPACTAEERGVDSDGDGLSDKQENIFCTDPFNPDTDGDTIPDATDPQPCQDAQILLAIRQTGMVSTTEKATATLQIQIKDTFNRYRNDVQIRLESNFGTLSEITAQATGVYEATISANDDGSAIVTAETIGADGRPDGRAKTSITVALKRRHPDNPDEPLPPGGDDDLFDGRPIVLESPGVNPGRYAAAGGVDGDLWVMAIDGASLDWQGAELQPYAKAYVQIDLQDGTVLTGYTNHKGWIHFQDTRLKGPVHVTVGAGDARYTTWMNVNARVISAGIVKRDITRAEASAKGSTITGVVRGFWGETGIETLPKKNTNVFDTINIAIVQVATRNYPLSSMNTGSILRPPDGSSATAAYFDIPPNLVLSSLTSPQNSRFKLDLLASGKYVVFALAGAGSNILAASQNPYQLKFTPMALGIQEVEVKAGETLDINLDLTVDLRTSENKRADLHFGQLPADNKTGQPLPMGLVLPLFNTGKGYIFLDVNTAYNFDGFQNPTQITYPSATHHTLQAANLSVRPMVVGLAARKAISGYDQPGISTLIMHPVENTDGQYQSVYLNNAKNWAKLPEFVTPAPPESNAFDAVGGKLNPSRIIAWKMPEGTDMTVLRLNYMTPPIHNKILGSDIGASQSHPLWEIYVPAPATSITLPALEPSAPDYPVLVNYAPSSKDDAYHYDKNTIELEINAYYMGPAPFDYNANFLTNDVNMNAWSVSQDSYLISTE